MKKEEYLESLRSALVRLKIADVDDIVAEYSQHFDFKLADGFSEEEIVAKLGSPVVVSGQFAESGGGENKKTTNKTLTYIGLVPVNVWTGIFFWFLGAWNVLLGVFSLACTAGAFMLITTVHLENLIPYMPYWNGLLLSFPLLFMSVLSAVGAIHCFLYMKQFFKAYLRWHKNTTAAANGKPVLPPVSKHPQLKPKFKRVLRNIMIVSLIGFGITFIIGYTAAALSAGAFEFWHTWYWFV